MNKDFDKIANNYQKSLIEVPSESKTLVNMKQNKKKCRDVDFKSQPIKCEYYSKGCSKCTLYY